MLVDFQRKPRSGDLAVGQIRCPLCQGDLVRARRRSVDRLRSLFVPVKRYRCENFRCQWEGNVSSRRATGAAGNAPVEGDIGGWSDHVPVAFVVSMVLAVAGIAFVLMFSTMESTFWFDEGERNTSSSFYEPTPERSAPRTASR